jgi:hypothetical protein
MALYWCIVLPLVAEALWFGMGKAILTRWPPVYYDDHGNRVVKMGGEFTLADWAFIVPRLAYHLPAIVVLPLDVLVDRLVERIAPTERWVHRVRDWTYWLVPGWTAAAYAVVLYWLIG